MDLTIVILNFNTRELLKKCLKSIFTKSWQHSIQITVVDNASSDDSVEMIKKQFPKVKLIQSSKNLGFAGGNNLALKETKSKYLLLLNSDTEVQKGALDNLIEFMDRGSYDIASCQLVDSRGNFQPNAGELPSFLPVLAWLTGADDFLGKILPLPSYQERNRDYYLDEKRVGWVSGSVMIVRVAIFKKIGFLDENIFMYGEDVEFCLRAKKAGFRVGWTKGARIIHLGGGSLKDPSLSQWRGEFRGLLYIYRKHYGPILEVILKGMIYLFIFIRMVIFGIIGRKEAAKTYAKILFSL